MRKNTRINRLLVVFAVALIIGVWSFTALVDTAWAKPGGGKPGGGEDTPPEYHLIDLGYMGGAFHSVALNLNDWGQVVGSAPFAGSLENAFLLTPDDTDGDGQPDLWYVDENQDGANNLAIQLNGVTEVDSHAKSVNENGQIAGFFHDGAGGTYGFVWQDGLLEELGSFESAGGIDGSTGGPDINNLGQVTACAYGPGYALAFVISPEDTDDDGTGDRWFVDDGSGGNALMISLGTLGGTYSSAAAIVDAGWIVGEASIANGLWHAFLVTPEDTDSDGWPDRWYRNDDGDSANDLMVDLGTLGGPGSSAVAVNALGQVVGSADRPDGTTHAFLVTPLDSDGDGAPDTWFRDTNADGINDLMEDLGTVSKRLKQSYAADINDWGQVVGTSKSDNGSSASFIWENGEMRHLETLTDNPDTGLWPKAINNAGEVVSENGCILVPVPANP